MDFEEKVQEALAKLDGTTASAVALLADVPAGELETYGGLPDSASQG